jgi:hypothetical protein
MSAVLSSHLVQRLRTYFTPHPITAQYYNRPKWHIILVLSLLNLVPFSVLRLVCPQQSVAATISVYSDIGLHYEIVKEGSHPNTVVHRHEIGRADIVWRVSP